MLSSSYSCRASHACVGTHLLATFVVVDEREEAKGHFAPAAEDWWSPPWWG